MADLVLVMEAVVRMVNETMAKERKVMKEEMGRLEE